MNLQRQRKALYNLQGACSMLWGLGTTHMIFWIGHSNKGRDSWISTASGYGNGRGRFACQEAVVGYVLHYTYLRCCVQTKWHGYILKLTHGPIPIKSSVWHVTLELCTLIQIGRHTDRRRDGWTEERDIWRQTEIQTERWMDEWMGREREKNIYIYLYIEREGGGEGETDRERTG